MGEPDKPLTRFDEIRDNPAELSEKEWRERLTPDQFYVCRQRGTEPAYVGRYVKFDKKGTYHCMACDAFLFKSEHKYPSNCGWPSFFAARPGDVKQRAGNSGENSDGGQETVKRREDNSLGMTRVEVSCRICNSHLGHVFPDGPLPTKERFCINSMAINFRKSQPTSSTPWTSSRLTASSARQRTQSPATSRDSTATSASSTQANSCGSRSTSTSASSSRSSSATRSRDNAGQRNRDGSAHGTREGSAQRALSATTPATMTACCGPLSLATGRCQPATTAIAAAAASSARQQAASCTSTRKFVEGSPTKIKHKTKKSTAAVSSSNDEGCTRSSTAAAATEAAAESATVEGNGETTSADAPTADEAK